MAVFILVLASVAAADTAAACAAAACAEEIDDCNAVRWVATCAHRLASDVCMPGHGPLVVPSGQVVAQFDGAPAVMSPELIPATALS